MRRQVTAWLSNAGVDTATDPRAPRLAHVVESSAIQEKTGLAYLHSSHCLGSGARIMWLNPHAEEASWEKHDRLKACSHIGDTHLHRSTIAQRWCRGTSHGSVACC